MLQLFVNGPPGSGKTTVAKLLCDEFQLELVATGELLRENMSTQTPLGREAERCIAAKSLIPDRVVVDMVAHKISACERQRCGWVLDGFPRTPDQCRALQRDQRLSPAVAIVLEISERECVKRVVGRRFDPITGQVYHCDALAGVDPAVVQRLVKRTDDSPEKLAPRFEAYRTFGEQTNALLAPITHRIDASGPPEAVLDRISTLLLALAKGGNNASNDDLMAFKVISSAVAPRSLIDHSDANNQSRLRAVGSAALGSSPMFGKATQLKRQMPQRIEEEEEEEVEIDACDAVGNTSELKSVSARPGTPSEPTFDYDDDSPYSEQIQQMTLTRQSSAAASPPSEADTSRTPSINNAKFAPCPSNSNSSGSGSNNNSNNADELLLTTSVMTPASMDADRFPRASDALDMERFRNMLLDGFDVLKHGRRGSPHTRTVFADVELKRVFWQKPTKDRRNKRAKLEQSLLLADVLQVVRGMKTDVLKRSGDVTKYERYLSLVADDRTLDMELPNDDQCEFLRRGFERLLLHQGDGRGGL